MTGFDIKFDVPFQEQVDFFGSKGYELSPFSWKDVWKDAHSRAFTVARVTQLDVLGDIRAALLESMESGKTLKQFKAELNDVLTTKGWLAPKGEKAKVVMPDGTIRKRLTGWRLDTIYQTNMAAAYQVGRYKQLDSVTWYKPWWMYMSVLDASRRKEHAKQHGKVYRHDHPFWDEWYPSNGFG